MGIAAAMLTVALGSALAASDAALGKRVYRKANCVGCHKWHGGGGGGYGGAALSLRATPLDAEGIREVVRCGRPGTRMPYHDRDAYKGAGCYGMTKAELGHDAPSKAAIFLRAEEIDAVVAYVITNLKGKGEPTYEDCVAFWGAGERQCEAMR
ncbi:MAG: c-type cytochrome [Geminicoccales bacterium]